MSTLKRWNETKFDLLIWFVNGRITDIVNRIQCNTQTRKAIGLATLLSPLWLCEFDRVKEHLRISERKSCGINLDIFYVCCFSCTIFCQFRPKVHEIYFCNIFFLLLLNQFKDNVINLYPFLHLPSLLMAFFRLEIYMLNLAISFSILSKSTTSRILA